MNNIKNRKERKQTHTHNEHVDSGRRKELLHEIRRLNVIYCMWELISYFIHQTTPDYFSVSFCVLHVCMYGEQNYGGRCISVLSLGFAG